MRHYLVVEGVKLFTAARPYFPGPVSWTSLNQLTPPGVAAIHNHLRCRLSCISTLGLQSGRQSSYSILCLEYYSRELFKAFLAYLFPSPSILSSLQNMNTASHLSETIRIASVH